MNSPEYGFTPALCIQPLVNCCYWATVVRNFKDNVEEMKGHGKYTHKKAGLSSNCLIDKCLHKQLSTSLPPNWQLSTDSCWLACIGFLLNIPCKNWRVVSVLTISAKSRYSRLLESGLCSRENLASAWINNSCNDKKKHACKVLYFAKVKVTLTDRISSYYCCIK